MPFLDLPHGQAIEAARGDAVVCVPLYGGHDHFVRCMRSLLAHTPASVKILIADDATPEPASREFVASLQAEGVLEHDVYWLARTENGGFVANMNGAFAAVAPADVVLVNSDVVVAAGWLDGMRGAAYADTIVATSTAMTNNGTIVSVPGRNHPQPALPANVTLDGAAALVRERSQRLYPRIPVAIGHCVYIKRMALDLVGDFDLAFAPGYGEEVDFSQRCVAMGLQHVVADDVLVVHHGSASFGDTPQRSELQQRHEDLINERYPYYAAATLDCSLDPLNPLGRSLGLAARTVRGLRVTIDARVLGSVLTGTQVHTLELIAALARTEAVNLRVVLPESPGDYVDDALHGLPRVEPVSVADIAGRPPDDLVHRPWQVNDEDDLVLLSRLAHNMVLTQQDLIAYRNPAYFSDADEWLQYRAVALRAMSLASMVLFFSSHARDDALADDLLRPDRARVVPIGTDHQVSLRRPEAREPGGAARLAGAPFLLCLGTDFKHKNRLFALRLLKALRERHGWQGRLALAGAHVLDGSSSADEAELLARDPALAQSVVQFAAVTEAEKAWLMNECAAVVYPTTYEGFGLVPFEAADFGRPCLFSRVASLGELLGQDAEMITAWDPQLSADRCIGLLTDPAQAAAQVARVREAASTLTWDRTAQGLLAAYEEALRMPAPSALRAEHRSFAKDASYWRLRESIGGTGMSLVGPEDPLLPEYAQRSLSALARRRITRGPLLAMLRVAGLLGGSRGTLKQ